MTRTVIGAALVAFGLAVALSAQESAPPELSRELTLEAHVLALERENLQLRVTLALTQNELIAASAPKANDDLATKQTALGRRIILALGGNPDADSLIWYDQQGKPLVPPLLARNRSTP